MTQRKAQQAMINLRKPMIKTQQRQRKKQLKLKNRIAPHLRRILFTANPVKRMTNKVLRIKEVKVMKGVQLKQLSWSQQSSKRLMPKVNICIIRAIHNIISISITYIHIKMLNSLLLQKKNLRNQNIPGLARKKLMYPKTKKVMKKRKKILVRKKVIRMPRKKFPGMRKKRLVQKIRRKIKLTKMMKMRRKWTSSRKQK